MEVLNFQSMVKKFIGSDRLSAQDNSPVWGNDTLWNAIAERCESPIEKKMCAAFYTHIRPIVSLRPYSFESVRDLVIASRSRVGIVLYAQHPVRRFRADFMLAYYNLDTDILRRVTVECDGAEFHLDKVRDRKRDREFMAEGYVVFRFTGSQIFRAADKAILAILEAF